jgi:hypothetical protein
VSISENEVVERTVLAIKVQYLDDGLDHTKVFEFEASISDEGIKNQIEEYGRNLKGNEKKVRIIGLEGIII